ncbi:MAG TPA: amidase [Verrucomicrobiae bacterium]|nr:amidase [Verrucomicrobiae bacterium]
MEKTRREFVGAGLGIVAQTALSAASEAELTTLSLSDVAEKVRKKVVSPVELTKACLRRIERLNPTLNAYITVIGEQALARARAAEGEPWSGPLHGIPIGIKDIFDTAGVRTTAASKLFENRVPDADAEVVRRLKAAGAVILGKHNLDEFACGGSGIVSYFGPVHNPWSLEYQTGGSSSGSAVAAAAGLDFGSVGNDAGGSIRIPAARCSAVGLKPTHGRVSLRGNLSCEWSITCVGPICRTVSDAALLLQAIAGYDPADPMSRDEAVPNYREALKMNTRRFRIGVPRAMFTAGLDAEHEAAFTEALRVLGQLVAETHDIELPPVRLTIGIDTSAEYYPEHQPYMAKTPELYQPQTRRTLEAAGRRTAGEYSRSQYEMAVARRAVSSIFSKIDLLVLPTLLLPPQSIEDVPKKSRGLLNLQLVMPFNLYGLPAVTVPSGFTKAGLPIGLQIVGPHFGEPRVLALAHGYEQSTVWHKRRPPV